LYSGHDALPLSELLEAACSTPSNPQPIPVSSSPANNARTTNLQQPPHVYGVKSSPAAKPASGTLTKASTPEDGNTHEITTVNQLSGVCVCVACAHVLF